MTPAQKQMITSLQDHGHASVVDAIKAAWKLNKMPARNLRTLGTYRVAVPMNAFAGIDYSSSSVSMTHIVEFKLSPDGQRFRVIGRLHPFPEGVCVDEGRI